MCPAPLALQDQFAPNNACFGCGPSNPKGLRLKSFVGPDGLFAEFLPEPHHQAFDDILNGGIIGTLLDCHSNWTATHALMLAGGLQGPPCTVTAEFSVKLRAPTPMDRAVQLLARPVTIDGDRCSVEAELRAHGKVTATCLGSFVAVKPGHPAYHRW